MGDCIFCKIVNKEQSSNVIYENDVLIAILDAFPAQKGHVLIIPKTHVKNIYELDENLGGTIFKTAIKISKALKEVFGESIEGLNIVQNNEVVGGQTVFHFHMHIIPRCSNDGILLKWNSVKLDKDELDNICTNLKRIIN